MSDLETKECPNCHEVSFSDFSFCMSCRYDYKMKMVNQNCFLDYQKEIDEKLGSYESIDEKVDNDSHSDKMFCPRCQSYHLTTNQNGYSVGKAATGFLLVGAVGLLAGGLGKNKIKITCLECNYSFNAGEYQEKIREEVELRKSIETTSTFKVVIFAAFIIAAIVGFFYFIFSLL